MAPRCSWRAASRVGAEFSTAFGPRRRQPWSAQGGGWGGCRWTGAGRISARVVAARPGGRRRRPVRAPTARCVAGAASRGGRGRPGVRRCAAAGSAAPWVRRRRLAVERQVLGPGGEVLGDERQLEPDGVVIEVAEGEVLKPGLLGGADAVLGAGAGAVQALEL